MSFNESVYRLSAEAVSEHRWMHGVLRQQFGTSTASANDVRTTDCAPDYLGA
ncbi:MULTISPECIES: hypothetical protein [Rhizobium]|uniref:Uncharacterized protein n=1 Tax=Rhizobium rhododendri TaxID=2506430 RepID=A0ABY8IDH4_9HYPH|nr:MULTISPECIES: hypothetical protein [Rhizobium]MBZ5758858.1 hypothetical protein [Rhizobium sp. VS19-DR96]MBZ5764312.1 hypothetical protein [Rhizobium sp. VS19-DR129.2]MBZ5771855.1 hypothetical protein [Rhizobium sp. VS19-DRK62.2]MBZ5783458.1 hypothetical protein [Rhizobium sp. VS19-DR121]MBZ5800906.1 hypothetical protein [Rhizobium sp. VS19-DR181]